MKTTISTLLLTTAMTLPFAANAQSLGFDIEGDLAISAVSFDSGDTEFFYTGDFDASYKLASFGSGEIGIEFGALLFGNDTNDANRYYYGLSYSSDFGKVTIGMPRSAYDTYGMAMKGPSDNTPNELNFIQGSLLQYFSIISSDIDIYGVSYDGNMGNAEIGLSYHRAEGPGGSADFAAIGAHYPLANMVASFAMEKASGTGIEFSRTELGLTGQSGKFGYGVSVSSGDLIFASSATWVKGIVSYDVTDRLTVMADYGKINTSGTDATITGIGVSYEVVDNLNIELNASRFETSSTSDIVALTARYNF